MIMDVEDLDKYCNRTLNRQIISEDQYLKAPFDDSCLEVLALTNIPFLWLPSIDFEFPYSRFFCKIANVLPGSNIYCSTLTISVMAIDRYYSVKRLKMTSNRRQCMQAVCVSLVIWIVSFILSIPLLLYYDTSMLYVVKQCTINRLSKVLNYVLRKPYIKIILPLKVIFINDYLFSVLYSIHLKSILILQSLVFILDLLSCSFRNNSFHNSEQGSGICSALHRSLRGTLYKFPSTLRSDASYLSRTKTPADNSKHQHPSPLAEKHRFFSCSNKRALDRIVLDADSEKDSFKFGVNPNRIAAYEHPTFLSEFWNFWKAHLLSASSAKIQALKEAVVFHDGLKDIARKCSNGKLQLHKEMISNIVFLGPEAVTSCRSFLTRWSKRHLKYTHLFLFLFVKDVLNLRTTAKSLLAMKLMLILFFCAYAVADNVFPDLEQVTPEMRFGLQLTLCGSKAITIVCREHSAIIELCKNKTGDWSDAAAFFDMGFYETLMREIPEYRFVDIIENLKMGRELSSVRFHSFAFVFQKYSRSIVFTYQQVCQYLIQHEIITYLVFKKYKNFIAEMEKCL
uniref:G_PROTEIN_RECEP_F1_2 domain-containing protein n=1 Tax=Heterorhabditis bacteriophora TaxID=37862 RepID=A0A1I7WUI3_HETBA